jgi:hypothetical protein
MSGSGCGRDSLSRAEDARAHTSRDPPRASRPLHAYLPSFTLPSVFAHAYLPHTFRLVLPLRLSLPALSPPTHPPHTRDSLSRAEVARAHTSRDPGCLAALSPQQPLLSMSGSGCGKESLSRAEGVRASAAGRASPSTFTLVNVALERVRVSRLSVSECRARASRDPGCLAALSPQQPLLS